MKYHSLETKEKLRQSRLGKKWSEDIKKKMSDSHKGLKVWNDGLKGVMKPNKTSFKKGDISWNINHKKIKKCIICGKEFQVIWARDFIKCCSKKCGHILSSKNNKSGVYQKCLKCDKEYYVPKNLVGKSKYCSRKCKDIHIWTIRREEVINNLSKSHIGQKCWNKGIKMPEISGENHPNWNGGSSFEEYGREFNQELKDKIRERDNHKCKLCPKIENGKSHIVHHINYDKKDNREENLILLCNSHHSKTNFNRDYWQEYLIKLVC